VGLRVTGELDTLTGDLLEQRVEELLGERPDVILDLSEMRVRSASAGLMGWWSLSATSTPGTSGVESQYGIGTHTDSGIAAIAAWIFLSWGRSRRPDPECAGGGRHRT
jgi:hypothetical protein